MLFPIPQLLHLLSPLQQWSLSFGMAHAQLSTVSSLFSAVGTVVSLLWLLPTVVQSFSNQGWKQRESMGVNINI